MVKEMGLDYGQGIAGIFRSRGGRAFSDNEVRSYGNVGESGQEVKRWLRAWCDKEEEEGGVDLAGGKETGLGHQEEEEGTATRELSDVQLTLAIDALILRREKEWRDESGDFGMESGGMYGLGGLEEGLKRSRNQEESGNRRVEGSGKGGTSEKGTGGLEGHDSGTNRERKTLGMDAFLQLGLEHARKEGTGDSGTGQVERTGVGRLDETRSKCAALTSELPLVPSHIQTLGTTASE
ncbi:hypothetical protein HDV00_000795 [Rhizophlyctis rosea]|nr:hypothetical protein HDV00_000795 [Rhizophlyctis rosea]